MRCFIPIRSNYFLSSLKLPSLRCHFPASRFAMGRGYDVFPRREIVEIREVCTSSGLSKSVERFAFWGSVLGGFLSGIGDGISGRDSLNDSEPSTFSEYKRCTCKTGYDMPPYYRDYASSNRSWSSIHRYNRYRSNYNEYHCNCDKCRKKEEEKYTINLSDETIKKIAEEISKNSSSKSETA